MESTGENGISERGVGSFSEIDILDAFWIVCFILSVLFFCIFCCVGLEQLFSSPQSHLAIVSPEDKALFLKEFHHILRSDFGFTLIGAKPLSLEEFGLSELNENPEKKQKFMQWLQSLFQHSSRFALRFLYSGRNEKRAVYIVDRKAFEKLHEDPDAPFAFETERIGKLFGYGEENAHFYLRFIALGKYLNKFITTFFKTPSLQALFQERIEKKYYYALDVPFTIEPPVNPQFNSFEEEWKWMVKNIHPSEEWDKPPFWVRKPVFCSKKSEETDRILKQFDNGATRLGAILHDDRWFERVLEIIEAK